MVRQHFAHLRVDGHVRRQRGQRVLEHERDVASAKAIQLRPAHAEHFAVLEFDRAFDTGVFGRQPKCSEEGLALARAAFPNDAEAFALVDRQGHALHRFHLAVRRVEGDGEIGDFENRFSHGGGD